MQDLTISVIGEGGTGKTLLVKKIHGKYYFPTVVFYSQLQPPRSHIQASLLKTAKYHLTLYDTPGNVKYMKNTTAALAHSQCAILLVDGDGLLYDEKQKMYTLLGIAFTHHVRHIITLILDVDEEQQFLEIASEIRQLQRKISFPEASFHFIPVSLDGDLNIFYEWAATPWYKGKNLLDTIHSIEFPQPNRLAPLRISVMNVHLTYNGETIVCGHIVYGTLKLGQQVIFAPGGHIGTVTSIQRNYEPIKVAYAGALIGFSVDGVEVEVLKRGVICGDAIDNPPSEVEFFKAQIAFNKPKNGIYVGYTPVLCIHSIHVACKIVELIGILSKKNVREVTCTNPKAIVNSEIAIVRMVPLKPICLESFEGLFSDLGRFSLRDGNHVVGFGVVKEVAKKPI